MQIRQMTSWDTIYQCTKNCDNIQTDAHVHMDTPTSTDCEPRRTECAFRNNHKRNDIVRKIGRKLSKKVRTAKFVPRKECVTMKPLGATKQATSIIIIIIIIIMVQHILYTHFTVPIQLFLVPWHFVTEKRSSSTELFVTNRLTVTSFQHFINAS